MGTIISDLSEKNKISQIEINDYRIIPIIFIPGVMGSNLKNSKGKVIWRYDGNMSLLGWSFPNSGPKERKKLLHPDRVEVDNRGMIVSSLRRAQQDKILRDNPVDDYDPESGKRLTEALKKLDENDPETKLFGSRFSRGWGEVAAASYGSFLDKLQNALFIDKPSRKKKLSKIYQDLLDKALATEFCAKGNVDILDPSYIDVMQQYYFPVYAMGYNWLGSNIQSAGLLKSKIADILKNYNSMGMKCNKVILITHSMGGLVARYYSECLDNGKGKDNIYGIIHGVMPSTGSAAAYTRMKRGTENPDSSLSGYFISHILSRNAAEMVAICSQSSGPLELLPSADYGPDWLKITDRHGREEKPIIGNDPYANLYLKRDVWWKLIDENLLNPFNSFNDKDQIDADWLIFKGLIFNVSAFHHDISMKYHDDTYSFYGKFKGDVIPPEFRTPEMARWKGTLAIGDPSMLKSTNILEDGRLDIKEVMERRTVTDELSVKEKAWKISSHYGGDISDYIYVGQCFTLQDCSDNGDGTVPLRSGEILHNCIKERLSVNVAHEAAYRNEISFSFTLRSIIKVAQKVKDDDEMAYK